MPIQYGTVDRTTSVPTGETYTEGVGYTKAPAGGAATTTKVGRYPTSGTSGSGGAVSGAEKDFVDSTKATDPAQIESQVAGEYAQEIAAIKAATMQLITDQQGKNTANEGRTRASSASSGVLGTDFGNASQKTAEDASTKANEDIYAAQDSELGAISSKINSEAATRISADKSTAQSGLEKNIGYQKDAIETVKTQIAAIAAATKLDDLPQDEYDSLYAHSGFEDPNQFNAFYEASRQAALQGTKLVGDATTGFYMPVVDPATGKLTYQNVIKPIVKPTQYGAYEFDPATGDVRTVAPAQPKIMSSGGRIWSVDPKTNKAVPLTEKSTGTGKVGYDKASIDQQLAVVSYADNYTDDYNATHGTKYTSDQIISAAKGSPDAFLTVLNLAVQKGVYVPASVSTGDGTDTSAADAAAQSAQDAADAAANAASDAAGADTSGGTNGG